MKEKFIRLPSGEKYYLGTGMFPYHENCPIDNTQLIGIHGCGPEDITFYRCITCTAQYSSKRGGVSKEDLKEQAYYYVKRAKDELSELEERKEKLLKILEIAKKNSFEIY